MKPLQVNALPKSHDRLWRDAVQESLFCARFEINPHFEHFGSPEIEIANADGKPILVICRSCAQFIRDQLDECIEMLDARDLYAGPEK
jgi:hypothetical protein